jgi:hypothetical protein
MRTPGAGEDSRGEDVLRGLNPWTGGGSFLFFGSLASLRQKSREVPKSLRWLVWLGSGWWIGLRQLPWEGRVEMSWPSTFRRSGRSCKPSVLHQRCTEFSSPKSAYASSDTDSTCANGTPNSLAPHLVICFPIFGTALAPRP